MTANKPQEIYHYTTGRCFLGIVADGVIKPATAFAPLGEPPVVWFTFSPDWEDMTNKLCLNDKGRVIHLSREETAALDGGLVRFVVDPKYAPYTWREFVRRSRIGEDTARLLADNCGRKNSVSRWRKPKDCSKAFNARSSRDKSPSTPNNNLHALFVTNSDCIRARTP